MRRLPLVVVLLVAAGARAQAPATNPPAAPPPLPRLDLRPVPGPKRLDLGHDLQLDLPPGFFFLDEEDARKVLATFGNVPGAHLLGLIGKDEANWFVEVHYLGEGHVKDDDAEHIDAAGILGAIRNATDTANRLRAQGGFKPIRVEGWAEPPRYDRPSHRLTWALQGEDTDGAVLNYNTRLLGRRGYASLILVVEPKELPAARPDLEALLGATRFTLGSRYEDFQPDDQVAAYGLAGLVAGGALAARELARGSVASDRSKVLLGVCGALVLIGSAMIVVGRRRRRGASAEPSRQEP
jgi:uncharacterized membrane-anchored protein